jgi:hypothetical protein
MEEREKGVDWFGNGREEKKERNEYYDFLCKVICSRDVTCVDCEQENKIILSRLVSNQQVNQLWENHEVNQMGHMSAE